MIKYALIFISLTTVLFFIYQKEVRSNSRKDFTEFHLQLIDNLISYVEEIKEYSKKSKRDSILYFHVNDGTSNTSKKDFDLIDCEKFKKGF